MKNKRTKITKKYQLSLVKKFQWQGVPKEGWYQFRSRRLVSEEGFMIGCRYYGCGTLSQWTCYKIELMRSQEW